MTLKLNIYSQMCNIGKSYIKHINKTIKEQQNHHNLFSIRQNKTIILLLPRVTPIVFVVLDEEEPQHTNALDFFTLKTPVLFRV